MRLIKSFMLIVIPILAAGTLSVRTIGSVLPARDTLAELIRQDTRYSDDTWCWKDICIGHTTRAQVERLLGRVAITDDQPTAARVNQPVSALNLPWTLYIGTPSGGFDDFQPWRRNDVARQIVFYGFDTPLLLGDMLVRLGAPTETYGYCAYKFGRRDVRCYAYMCYQGNLCMRVQHTSPHLSRFSRVNMILFLEPTYRQPYNTPIPFAHTEWRGYGRFEAAWQR